MADEEIMPPRGSISVGLTGVAAIGMAGGVGTTTGIPLTLRTSEASDEASFAGIVLPSITITSIIVPERKTKSGVLVASTSVLWNSIVKALSNDWSLAYKLLPTQWEEIVAGAFKQDGYDDVILTPRSGDHGRDLIAVKHGVGSVKILGSVKAYAPDHKVPYDAVRALVGVVAMEPDASKGIIATTSGFPPRIELDPLIAPLLPTRLEMIDGPNLQKWLASLSKS
jgi:restriction system protein